MNFIPWNTITEAVESMKVHKAKAAEAAYQRDLHADVVKILNDCIPRQMNMKQRADGIDQAADDVIAYFKGKA